MMMDAGTMGMPGMLGMAGMSVPMAMPASGTGMMVPRCTIRMETMSGGMRMTCMGVDEMSTRMMQNLMGMMGSGMMSCAMMLNGMMVMRCNMTMGMCRTEMTDEGMVISYTSGDPAMMAMIQATCNCMAMMMQQGCSCCVMMNNMPVCCS
ncbi:MAG: hypothetical protein ACJ79A_20315 [Gemmatimonadaceae bacterium]